jgi:hypothetical protein
MEQQETAPIATFKSWRQIFVLGDYFKPSHKSLREKPAPG